MRDFRSTSIGELHWPLIGIVVLLSALGIYNLHSAAAARDADLYLTQLYWLLLGGGVAGLLMVLDYRVTEGLAYPFYAVVVLLLVAVLVQGKTAGGAQRWLNLGPIVFQPSELAKLGTVLCLAHYFSTRLVPGGFTIGSLFRPFNPSRPLGVLGALILFWNKPWMMDPVGEMARAVHDRLGSRLPEPGDLLWFRALVLITIVALVAAMILVAVRFAREQALLDPWPEGRLRRLVILLALLGLSALLWVVFNWSLPLLRDPFGVALAYLGSEGAQGGAYAELRPGLGLRLTFLALAVGYMLTALYRLRAGASKLVDILIAPMDLLALPAVLVLVEPDLGTAGIIVLIGLTMVFAVGVRLRSLIIMGVLGLAVAGVGWFGILKDYQKRRILTFIDPEHDIKGAGWNAVQSMIAVGSGRWWGKGHKGGTQTQLSFLPEQHTDFAFSVWA